MNQVILVCILIILLVLVFLILSKRFSKDKTDSSPELLSQLDFFQQQNQEFKAKNEILRDQLNQKEKQLVKAETSLDHTVNLLRQTQQANQQHEQKLEKLAQQIATQTNATLQEYQFQQLQQTLTPLKERLTSFEKKIDDTYEKELREKASLKNELKTLLNLNQTLSEDAQNLTNALKGDRKLQGNWGELILERVLEKSGLQKGREYQTQVHDTNQEGSRIQPDVVIFLPENKHLIIDAKVSLNAFEAWSNADFEEDREAAIRNHLISVRTHVKQLSQKNYFEAKKLQSPDYVLLFMPVEPAFSLTLKEDPELFSWAWQQNIVIVSPTTLLATLRTISLIWKQENQSKNVHEIARIAGKMHDKFIGFLTDLDKINHHILASQTAYHEAMNKLKTGKGNLITSANKIRILGAKTNKKIPSNHQSIERD